MYMCNKLRNNVYCRLSETKCIISQTHDTFIIMMLSLNGVRLHIMVSTAAASNHRNSIRKNILWISFYNFNLIAEACVFTWNMLILRSYINTFYICTGPTNPATAELHIILAMQLFYLLHLFTTQLRFEHALEY